MTRNIVFSDALRDTSIAWFAIREEDVREAIEAPDWEQSKDFDGITLGFYTKRHERIGTDVYLLVYTQKDKEQEIAYHAFWIYPDLTVGLSVSEPLILLQQFALRFGFPIRVGNLLNKFIFRETITVRGPLNPERLVEILCPEDSKGMPSLFIKYVEDGGSYHIHCALAFCIDLEAYTQWLVRGRSIQGIDYQIAPQLQGHVTLQSLIGARGTLEFQMNYNQIGQGILFRVKGADYHLEVGFTTAHFYISRNGDTLQRALQSFYMPTDHVHFFAIWEPSMLRLIVLDEAHRAVLARGVEPEQAITDPTSILNTRHTIPPFSLINAARKASLVPIQRYGSREEVYEYVASALDTIPDKVTTTGMFSAFWDIEHQGSRITSRIPKRETDIHPTIHTLLFDIALVQNLEVSREYPIAGGQLDFLFTAPLTTGEIISVCVEFKHAHSSDLLHGLLVQLPAYMQAKGSDFGVYCVTYFKGRDFGEPAQYDEHSLKMALEVERRSAGLGRIAVRILNLSRPKPPSKA